MTKALNYKEFMDYSLQHYNKGGDGYYECWDEKEFDNYVKQFGEITKSKALQMYRVSDSITKDRMCSWQGEWIMKLYENKREITLKDALTILFTNNRPNQNIEYMISFDEVTRVVAFGKSWTKKDTSNWGKNVCKYWIHQENCPTIGYNDVDLFLVDLMHISGMQKYFNQKKFHIWEEI